MKMMTTVLVLAVEKELVPQEDFERALEVDSLKLQPWPQAQMAVMSD